MGNFGFCHTWLALLEYFTQFKFGDENCESENKPWLSVLNVDSKT